MELNREQIIKALECCATEAPNCAECPYESKCYNRIFGDALAVAKELTKENEKFTINMNAYGLTAKRLAEENERLTEELAKSYKALDEQMNFYCSFTKSKVSDCPINDEIAKAKADTVRKMAERLKKECLLYRGYEMLLEGTIDQIAKEMMEGETQ